MWYFADYLSILLAMRKNLTWSIFAFIVSFTTSLFAQSTIKHPVLNTPQIIEFSNPINSKEHAKVLNKVGNYSTSVTWKKLNQIESDGELHTRYQILYKRIPSQLGIGIVHEFHDHESSKKSGIFRVNGDFIPEHLFQGQLRIASDEALKTVLNAHPSEQYYWQDPQRDEFLKRITGNRDTSYAPKGISVYCSRNFLLDQPQRLCWKFKVYSSEPLFGIEVFVDAETGEIIAEQNLILHGNKPGTAVTKYSGPRTIITDSISPTEYRLVESLNGRKIETYNMQKGTNYAAAVHFKDADNVWNNINANKDEVATDAHWGAEATHDYFLQKHGRNSFDNNGAKIYSFVHYGNNFGNAYWDGTAMTYGDGDGVTFTSPLTTIDVCGHEIAHAVTTNSANLTYQNESGALNESFSDIFGESIENWARPTKWSWIIGEDCTPGGAGIRSMSNPNAFNHPKYYKGNKWYSGALDNGGVHINSGVQNYWFYLLASGAIGTNEVGNSFNIKQLGFDKAAKIAYRNLTVYLTPSSTYADARTYSILSASDLYGTCSDEVIATTNAWWVCGIGPKYDSSYVKANFKSDTLACQKTTAIKFTNLSENSSKSTWYFGDGNTTQTFSPLHTYSNYGHYNIKLVAESCFNGKKDSIAINNHVKIDSTYDICNAVLLPAKGSATTQVCHGFIYDDGGEDNYGPLKTVRLNLDITNADSILFRFKYVDYENGFDSLVLFHTDTTQANKIAAFTGTSVPFGGSWFKLQKSKIIFKQYSDPMVEGKGFKFEYIGYRKIISVDLGLDTATICYGDSYTFNPIFKNVISADAKFYPPSDMNIFSGNVGPKVTTKYYYSVFDACTGLGTTDSIVVKVREPLKVTITPATEDVCPGSNFDLIATATGGDKSNYTYLWDNGLSNNSTHKVVVNDTIVYKLIVSDGCTDTLAFDSIQLNIPAPLDLVSNIHDTLLCFGGSLDVALIPSGGKPNQHSIVWTPATLSGDTFNFVPPVGNSSYQAILSDACMPFNDTIEFNVKKLPAISGNMTVNPTKMCFGDTTNMTFTVVGGDSTKYRFIWNYKDTLSTLSVSESQTISKNLILTILDGCNDSLVLVQPIVVSPTKLEINTTRFDSIMCWYNQSGRIDFNYDILNNPVTIEWSSNTTATGRSAIDLDAGKYWVRIADTFGCVDTNFYTIKKFPRVYKASNDTMVHRGTFAQLIVFNSSARTWSGRRIYGIPTKEIVRAMPLRDTVYWVDGTDIYGCIAVDTVKVSVIDPPDYKLPNIFSPNGDRQNETWNLIALEDYEEYDVIIMDRQGKIVYEKVGYDNSWRATDKDGNELPNGVYYYQLKNRESGLTQKGYIQVIR